MRDLRIVICTGIDKASKLRVLEAAREAAPGYGEGFGVHLYDVWSFIQEVAQEKGYVGRRETITELPGRELRTLRENACYRIADRFDKEIATERDRTRHVCVVITRTIAPSPAGLVRTLDETHGVFDAEVCLSIVDNIERMQENLARDSVWAQVALSQEEVLSRRQDELTNTDEWCRDWIGRGRHFMIAVNEPPETLLGVLFPSVAGPRARRRVYISFPITHADEAIRKKKTEFVARLRKKWVVFDPGSVTEYDRAVSEYKSVGPGEKKAQARKWLERLGPVTVNNDYQLITQSDGIVVYYPSVPVKIRDSSGEWVDAEQKVLSAGVIAEMIHAKNEQRTVQALWLSEQLPSPFFFRYCDPPIFKSESEFYERLD